MTVDLIECKKNSKFSIFETYPELKTLWKDKDHIENAMGAYNEWNSNPDEKGSFYLITKSERTVGVTGWWPISDTEIGLRWHGIIPRFRGNNYSYIAILELCLTVPMEYNRLYEIAYTQKAKEYFMACGFNEVINEECKKRVRESSGDETLVLIFPEENNILVVATEKGNFNFKIV